jgi:predicted N-formylglutamate amidohydrolase
LAELELLVTCEHGGNAVPQQYLALFPDSARQALESHRGFDAGALTVARALSEAVGAPLLYSETTRLLVDLNRSPRHPRLYSEYTRTLGAADKSKLLAAHYTPYRSAVERAVEGAAARGTFLLHVSSHSFTPSLGGAERNADVGLLFDPGRAPEARWARLWQDALAAELPGWRIRRNYPYRGTSDGLTTHLRRRTPDVSYAGIELEVNQRRVPEADWQEHVAGIAASLARIANAAPRAPAVA